MSAKHKLNDSKGGLVSAPAAPVRNYAQEQDRVWRIGLFLAFGWFFACALLFLLLPDLDFSKMDGASRAMSIFAIGFPAGMILLASAVASYSVGLKRHARALEGKLSATRVSLAALERSVNTMASLHAPPEIVVASDGVLREIDEEMPLIDDTALVLGSCETIENEAPFVSQRAGADEAARDNQPALQGFEEGTAEPAVTDAVLMKALNLPDDENDELGFEALRKALQERDLRVLILHTQYVLETLSNLEIYIDDFDVLAVSAGLWRRFAEGERGRSVKALGAIREPSVNAVIVSHMRADSDFRNEVLQFLRSFDHFAEERVPGFSDETLLEFGKTRTSKTFMLLARANGVFDLE